MVQVEEAINLLLEQISFQQETVEIFILDGVGSILSEDIFASFSVPPFPKSGMDGYAVFSKDIEMADKDNPVALTVIGQLMAGDAMNYVSQPRTAVKIMTGGAIPEGYDCVVKQEDTDYGEETVTIYKKASLWQNYCKAGEDIQKGQLVVKKHTRLTCSHIGILASMGINKVNILKPMKVGIISTGSELIKPGESLPPAKVYNSCGYTIAAFLQSVGVKVEYMDICHDEIDQMCDKIKKQMGQVHMLITTGAVSVGKKDIMPEVLEKIEAKQIFRRVNMKPGTPVLASMYKGKPILSMSGNPFAALINFHIFFWPILEKFMCNKEFGIKKAKAKVKEGFLKSNTLRRFVRAYEEEGLVILPATSHFSSVLSSMVDCNCLIDQPPNQEIHTGDVVQIIYLK